MAKYPLMPEINAQTLNEIALRRFPEYDGSFKYVGNSEGYMIHKNPFTRAFIKVKHKPNKNQTVLVITQTVTPLGTLLIGALWVGLIYRNFMKEVEEVYKEEFDKLAAGRS